MDLSLSPSSRQRLDSEAYWQASSDAVAAAPGSPASASSRASPVGRADSNGSAFGRLGRADSGKYWEASGWDPDGRVYTGAGCGQTNHLFAVQPDSPKRQPPALGARSSAPAGGAHGATRGGGYATVPRADSGGSAFCRVDSGKYWAASNWDPDGRVYAGADCGQTNHLIAVQPDSPKGHPMVAEPAAVSTAQAPVAGTSAAPTDARVSRVIGLPQGAVPSKQPAESTPDARQGSVTDDSSVFWNQEPGGLSPGHFRAHNDNSDAYWDRGGWGDRDDAPATQGSKATTDYFKVADAAGGDTEQVSGVWAGGLTCKAMGLQNEKGPLIDLALAAGFRPDFEQIYQVSGQAVGLGGFGVVRRGHHAASDTACVVKTVDKEAAGEQYRMSIVDKGLGEQLLRMSIESPHPNITRYFDVLESPKRFHVVMEELMGLELLEQMERAFPVTEAYLRPIMKHIFASLAHIHDVIGLVHRDVKLTNFRYRTSAKDSDLVLFDFDFSADLHTPWDRLACGTLIFLPPEVFAMTARTPHLAALDLWAAGVIFFMLLTGKPVFQDWQVRLLGKSRSADQQKSLLKRALGPEALSSVSEEAVELLRRLLDIEPSSRATAAEALSHRWFSVGDDTRQLRVDSGAYRSMKCGSSRSVQATDLSPKSSRSPKNRRRQDEGKLERIISEGYEPLAPE